MLLSRQFHPNSSSILAKMKNLAKYEKVMKKCMQEKKICMCVNYKLQKSSSSIQELIFASVQYKKLGPRNIPWSAWSVSLLVSLFCKRTNIQFLSKKIQNFHIRTLFFFFRKKYSGVPNRRTGLNKRTGWNISQKLINAQGLIIIIL